MAVLRCPREIPLRSSRSRSSSGELAARLDDLYRTFDHVNSASDPVHIVRRYTAPEDREVVGFFAAALAFGRVAIDHDIIDDSDRKPDYALECRIGQRRYETDDAAVRILGYDSGPRMPAPCLGEHSIMVLQELLGYGDERELLDRQSYASSSRTAFVKVSYAWQR